LAAQKKEEFRPTKGTGNGGGERWKKVGFGPSLYERKNKARERGRGE